MAKPKRDIEKLTTNDKKFLLEKLGIDNILDIDKTILKELKERLKKIKDVRVQGRILYKIWDVIICVIVASFADNNDWQDIAQFVEDHYSWFKQFLQMTGGIPSWQTYERIMSLIGSDELNSILVEFFKEITLNNNNEQKLLNLDGRVNNGSSRKETINNEAIKGVNSLNGYSTEYGYCIISKMIDEKSNEIPAIEDLIKGLDLNGYTVTWDALNTQTANVKAVVDAGGDYIVPIKGNQGTFMKDLVDYFDDDKLDEIKAGNNQSEYSVYYEKSHSCNITYEHFQTSDINWYYKKDDWSKLQSIGLVKKTIEKAELHIVEKFIKGKKVKKKEKRIVTKIETRYYISSRTVNIKEFSESTRRHWGVENKVHWHLDFTFRQDDNTTANKKALFNLEIIHKFVLASLNRAQTRYERKSLKTIRKHLSNNIESNLPMLICNLMLVSK